MYCLMKSFFVLLLMLPATLLANGIDSIKNECFSKFNKDSLKTGFFYKDNIAFIFTAPEGWLLDNYSAVHQGLPAVFYPVGQTWKDSPVIMYARARRITEDVKTIKQQVNETIRSFRDAGSPKYQSQFIERYQINDNHSFDIYFYRGDQWGNSEAAGYSIDHGYIVFFVLNAKNKIIFNNSIKPFKELMKSYLFVTDNITYEHKQLNKFRF